MGFRYSRYSYNRFRSNVQQYEQSASPVDQSELTDPNVQVRIQNIRSKNGLSDWEKNFLQSIETYFGHKNGLTYGQYNTFRKIEAKFSDAAVAEQDEFQKSFTDDMRSDMKIVAGVYEKKMLPYHKDLRDKVVNDDKFIPKKSQWEKFMKNKYAEGYLHNMKSPPKFKIGDTVCPSSHDKSEMYKTAIIIDNEGLTPISHAVGGKMYMILPYGQTSTLLVEERAIKFCRR